MRIRQDTAMLYLQDMWQSNMHATMLEDGIPEVVVAGWRSSKGLTRVASCTIVPIREGVTGWVAELDFR